MLLNFIKTEVAVLNFKAKLLIEEIINSYFKSAKITKINYYLKSSRSLVHGISQKSPLFGNHNLGKFFLLR